jgi:hypothetical protein
MAMACGDSHVDSGPRADHHIGLMQAHDPVVIPVEAKNAAATMAVAPARITQPRRSLFITTTP